MHARVEVSDSGLQWQPFVLDVDEPLLLTSEINDSPNPFLDIALNVSFTGPSGQNYIVPGYYAGDGAGNGKGNVWRTRFSPDQPGTWQYEVSFQQGENIAVEEDAGAIALPDDGSSGTFVVDPVPANAPGFLAKGRLSYTGGHYLQFANGDYWIKGGVDSPENFFGYAGFSGTENQPNGVSEFGLVNGLHHYEPHIADWQQGDPDFLNIDTGVDGKGIIGAVNYLSTQAVNSIYFLPMNLGGDGRDTYPFLGASGSEFDNTHYNVAKLHQWNLVLNHMQRKGIAAHIVLAEQETGNTEWLDGGELGIQRKLFYRELIARFSYLLAVKWNLSEESRYTTEQHLAFSEYLRRIDWARHPIAVHSWINQPERQYPGLLGADNFEATSIQFTAENAGRFVEEWRTNSVDAGRPWVIDMDEIAPGNIGLSDTNIDQLRQSVLYPVYFSGANIEWYFGYHPLPLGGDIRTEDFRTREPMYRYMRIAREFMQENLPFNDMYPADHLFSGNNTLPVEVFAKHGEVYAVYLPAGTESGSMDIPNGEYEVSWMNPLTGQMEDPQTRVVEEGIDISLPEVAADTESAIPDNQQDWVFLVKLQSTELAESGDQTDSSEPDQPVEPIPVIEISEQTIVPDNAGQDIEDTAFTEQSVAPEIGAAQSQGVQSSQNNTGSISFWSLALLALIIVGTRRCVATCRVTTRLPGCMLLSSVSDWFADRPRFVNTETTPGN